jgi:DNA-directed RNA polymerase subunit RPC12/RpoP
VTATANCPSCGAPVTFAIGSSAVVVCNYCRSVVARTDRGLETFGKVADLIDTGSPLHVGASGRYRGQPFRLTGRTQLRHQAGGVWDEWYAAFDDGRWGWIAEAQGRFYVTFKVEANAPPPEQLRLGTPVPGFEPMVVAEIGKAVVESAEGELPWRPMPGEAYAYADLTGEERRFATIDYSEEPPVVFNGTEEGFKELGIEGGEPARRERIATAALNCSKCGGALDLKAPDRAERVWCPHCGAGHDITAGKLQFFAMLGKKRKERPIANGSTGTIEGDQYVVAGFMQRSVHFDITYYWTEYLLWNREKGYRWLVHSDDHWSFVTPLRPGEVQDVPFFGDVAKRVHYDGRGYRLFQPATATVTYVDGEFYWRVNRGEQVDTADYIAPPYGISKETTKGGAQEVAYSHARYMQPKEVEEAFGLQNLTRPVTPGPLQPYTGARLGKAWLLMLIVLFAIGIFLSVTRPRRVVYSNFIDLTASAPAPGDPDNARVVFSEPFELSGDYNLSVSGSAALQNSWLYVAGDLFNEAKGTLQTFDFPLEYYSGVEGGESWSEGDRDRNVYLSRPEKGTYVLRLEAQWEQGKTPPPLHVQVREGVFRWLHFLLALIAISIFPFFALMGQYGFESKRWADSAYNPYAALQSSEDDDDEE